MFLLFELAKLPDNIMDKMEAHDQFVDCYEPYDEHIMVVFELPKKDYVTVIKPFLEGKYSKIDKKYVRLNFRDKNSTNYQILSKDPELKEYWEDTLNTTLPSGAEV